ncbi:papain family cysteine protease [Ancylostoma duodenale]|uniref:Papain family cysteine protease n=1 Tax=Ancylostoma duodenale TaxID=51022 RepID=A0A0C2CZF8_9BILA|nr:papain family cysteine protease [Ancylostoma duodenale]
MQREGVVTGGKYRDENSCRPYAFYPCGNHANDPFYGPCPDDFWPTPKCRKTCQRKYNKCYREDKHFATKVYNLPNNEKSIRQEIYKNGPVVAVFKVYDDFNHYKEGIYVHKWGRETGAHAVKIVGWGRENGTDFWLIANSWNTDWGENGGYFRIARGNNECDIEAKVVSGVMRV